MEELLEEEDFDLFLLVVQMGETKGSPRALVLKNTCMWYDCDKIFTSCANLHPLQCVSKKSSKMTIDLCAPLSENFTTGIYKKMKGKIFLQHLFFVLCAFRGHTGQLQ